MVDTETIEKVIANLKESEIDQVRVGKEIQVIYKHQQKKQKTVNSDVANYLEGHLKYSKIPDSKILSGI